MRTVFIPQNLDLERLTQEVPPPFNYYVDNFKYIVSLITEIPVYNKSVLNTMNFVPINAQKLKSEIHNYLRYLEYLIKNDVIESDNHYIKDKKSKGYRFTQQYRTEVKPGLIHKRTLLKKLNKKSRQDPKTKRKYHYLTKWFDSGLQIDFPATQEYLLEELNTNQSIGIENALLKFNSRYLSAYWLNEKNFFYVVDSNVGRFHSILTCLKSELRNFITYRGQSLVSVDIVNSQPCLSVALLDPNFYSITSNHTDQSNLFNIHNISTSSTNKHNHFLSPSSLYNITSYIMLSKSHYTSKSQPFMQYKTLVSNGRLYEYIEEKYWQNTGIKVPSRKDLKSIVFTVLFTDNRFYGQKEAAPKRIFRSIFPQVYEVFSQIKKKDSTALPRLLQTIESKLMLDLVAKRIATERPNMPIFTIHDSIVCPDGNEIYVAEVIKEEMEKAIGVTPCLKFEYWKPENLKNSINASGKIPAFNESSSTADTDNENQ